MKVGDKVKLPVEFVVVAIGGAEGKEEVALAPVDAHVTHLSVPLADLQPTPTPEPAAP